jgi:hypothetical protein
LILLVCGITVAGEKASLIGREVAVPRHLQSGEEFELPIDSLIQFGQKRFSARWTIQEGQADRVIEFLKSLQILPPGAKNLIIASRGEETP